MEKAKKMLWLKDFAVVAENVAWHQMWIALCIGLTILGAMIVGLFLFNDISIWMETGMALFAGLVIVSMVEYVVLHAIASIAERRMWRLGYTEEELEGEICRQKL